IAYRNLGRVQKALGCYEQALDISRKISDKRSEGIWLGNIGIAYRDLGEVQQAITHYEQVLAISRKNGDRRSSGNGFGNLGLAKAISGDVRAGIVDLKQSVTILAEIGAVDHLQYRLASLAEAHLLNKDNTAALSAITQAQTHNVPLNNYAVSTLAGIIHLQMSDAGAAQTAFEIAIGQASQLLEVTPTLYDSLYTRGTAQAGLSLIRNG